MNGVHPKRRVYAELDEWLAHASSNPDARWDIDSVMFSLDFCDNEDLDDIPREDLRRYAESWLRINIAPSKDLG